MKTTTTKLNINILTYSAKSAAIRAAKNSGLEPAEFTIKQTPEGRFAIHRIAALEPAAYAAPAPAPTHAPALTPTPLPQAIPDQDADAAASEAADIFGINKPRKRHLDILAAAHAGKRPDAPNLDAASHDYYRRWLIAMNDAILQGDRAKMQEIADRMKPKAGYCSSRSPIRAYGLLTLIAMRTKH
jgi:hypothetical protein